MRSILLFSFLFLFVSSVFASPVNKDAVCEFDISNSPSLAQECVVVGAQADGHLIIGANFRFKHQS